MSRQPWIHSASLDLSLIAGPPLFAALFTYLLRNQFSSHTSVGPLLWLLLVVCVDVAHVYASIFRTYWGSTLERRSLLWSVPLACWIGGVALYAISASVFWSVLAYIAVFHFIRQQYGFAMIYARTEHAHPAWYRRLDQVTIYAATLYPLLFWHLHLPRNFNWFIDGDFLRLPITPLTILMGEIALYAYVAIVIAYFLKEAWMSFQVRQVNTPKNALIIGTIASWFVGIVYLNNDLAFTFTNVVSHGVPYVVLVWIYGTKKNPETVARVWGRSLFNIECLPIYVGLLLVFAYVEEGLWDAIVWRDHSNLFAFFSWLPLATEPLWLALLVPILALPQSTHYVFDAFLWRRQGADSDWKMILFKNQETIS